MTRPPEKYLSRELSRYALELRYEDLPEAVVWQAKRMILDTLGCAIGALEAEPVRIARSLALDVEGKKRKATLLGTKHQSTLDLATFVNVIMARYLDLNDYKPKPGGHPSDNILTCLTVSDYANASGKEFLLSVVLAYEVQGAFGEATRFKDREWAWDYTNNVLIASALVASRLMGLSIEKTTEAVNIAVNAHVSMLEVRSGEISLWKAGSSGEAAKCGVFSAMLADEGMTGPARIFEGEFGYFKQVMGTDAVRIGDFGRNGKYSISDTRIKLYPSNGSTQTGICAAVNARKSIGNVGDIDRIEILTNARTYKGSGTGAEKWAPKTHETADHSLPFTVASALMDGTVSPSSYTHERLQCPALAALINKITVEEDAALTAMFPAKSATSLRIHLKSGQTIVETVEFPKGHPQYPVTDQEIEAKFKSLAKGYLKQDQIQSVIDFIWALEGQNNLKPLLAALLADTV